MITPRLARAARLPWALVGSTLALLGASCGGDARDPDAGPTGFGPDADSAAPDGEAPGDAAAEPFEQMDTTEPWRSGERLRARVVDGGDGALLFDGWVDTGLGVDCAFRVVEPELARCFPLGAAPELFAFGYRDPQCQRAVAFVAAEPGTLVAGSGTGGAPNRCEPPTPGEPQVFYRVVGPVADVATLYQREGERCFSGFEAPPIDFVELEPVDASEFVSARVGESSGAVGARWFAASDGSFETATLLTGDGAECDLLDAPSMPARCVGLDLTEVIGTDVSTSSQCDAPLLVRERTGQCGDGGLVIAPQLHCDGMRGGYGRPSRYLEADWVRDPPLFAFDFGTETCGRVDFGGGFELLAPSAATPAELPSIVEVAERGSGQLRARFGKSSDGRKARNATPPQLDQHVQRYFYDTHHDLHCEPRSTRETDTGGEEWRCLPLASDGRVETVYLDSGCTTPALLASRGSCAAVIDAEIFATHSELVAGSTPGGVDLVITDVLRALPGAELQAQFYYRTGDALDPRCEPVPLSSSSAARPAEAISIDRFAPIRWYVE